MMALKSPMLPSPNGALVSAFSPYSESPTSPARFESVTHRPMSSDLASSLQPPHRSSPHPTSPSDIADPSPIATSSNGTDTTDIDDTGIESETEIQAELASSSSPDQDDRDRDRPTPKWPVRQRYGERASLQLETKNAAEAAHRPRSDEDEEPSSVIHAPQGFDAFHRKSPPSVNRTTPTPPKRPDPEVVISLSEDENDGPKKPSHSPVSPPTLLTTVPPARDWSATPRAQTRLDLENQSLDSDIRKLNSRSSSRSSNLADIPEGFDTDYEDGGHDTLFNHTIERFQETKDEVEALKIALSECWTLCNTLAGLSYIHRERIFSFSGKGDRQEQAWKSCWKLCQNLYETRDADTASQVRPTLDLCRDFCQCLFEVRQRENEKADSVLRVSFELNNHLYNTHDRNLPEAFRERTLDFYITLCHRLMKQRSELARETDSLLGACWSLAEMLFSLRQNRREGKAADEELLGSAVQSCWELCDLFREGWTQIRPDRGTPRPSQTTFTQAFQQAKQSQSVTAQWAYVPQESDESEDEDFGRQNPETPTTVFEDMQQLSPDDNLPPNILVLGPPEQISRRQPQPSNRRPQHAQHWSSGSSTLSGYSQNSRTTTSSNSTIINQASSATSPYPPPAAPSASTEDPHLTCLKVLIVKAAMNAGYQRPRSPSSTRSPPSLPLGSSSSSTSIASGKAPGSSSSASGNANNKSSSVHSSPNLSSTSSIKGSSAPSTATLSAFVKSLPSNSFGTQPWQTSLLASYKTLVASDPTFSSPSFPYPPGPHNSASAASSQGPSATAGTGDVLAPGAPSRRARASDVARSVKWMVGGHGGRYAWLRELYRLVFGFRVEEGEVRVDVVIQS